MSAINYLDYQKYFSEKEMWNKIRKFAQKAGVKVIYAVLLLFYVLQSPDVSKEDKAKILGALGYFILPLDLMPDTIPVAGYTDDIAALLWALCAVYANVTPEIEWKAKQKLHEWFGEFDEEEIILF